MAETSEQQTNKKRSKQKMSLFRRFRKEAVARIMLAGVRASRGGSQKNITRLHRVALVSLKSCVPLRMRLAKNMKLAGLYRNGLVNEYFDRAADQFGYIMHIFRAGWPDSGTADHFAYDKSVQHLEQAHAAGRGVLVISPHLCCYPLVPRFISDRIPCTIYMRRSPDPRKHEINKAIVQIGGANVVYPPADATRSERLTIALKILRDGKILFVTPDLIRKPDKGVPVTVLGRNVHFPTGVPIMAMRTGAPVTVLMWNYQNGRYHLRFDEPRDLTGRGNRQRRAAESVEYFARKMDEWVREYPEMWWNWLDKRWTWTLRGQMTYPTG